MTDAIRSADISQQLARLPALQGLLDLIIAELGLSGQSTPLELELVRGPRGFAPGSRIAQIWPKRLAALG
jgi:hypothetical protein